jgi:hypothetical protein
MVNRNDESDQNRSIEERSKALFDASVAELDAHTRSKLSRARQAALAELERTKRPLMWRVLGPVGGVAAAAFVLIAMFAPLRFTPTSVEGTAMPVEDLDIVAEGENLEMLQDLDFYAWLDSPAAAPNDG